MAKKIPWEVAVAKVREYFFGRRECVNAPSPPETRIEIDYRENDLLIITFPNVLSEAAIKWIKQGFVLSKKEENHILILGGNPTVIHVKDYYPNYELKKEDGEG